jgi:tRNA(Ile)-lysidine synthetase-like protein
MWVGRFAATLGIPFELGALALGPETTETAARHARYAWLREVVQRRGAHYLVTAHHKDDQVETVLMRTLRGSAPAGLAGMTARAKGGLTRPLLPFRRAELAAFVVERSLPVHHDPANRDPRHLRSWVRGVLLPHVVERMGPEVIDSLARVSRFAAADRRAWDHALELIPPDELRIAAQGFDVARDALSRYDPALAAAVLRAAARRVGLVLGPRRARSLIRLAGRQSGRREALGGGWEAVVEFDRLRVARLSGADAPPVVIETASERGSAELGGGAFRLSWQPGLAPDAIDRGAWTTWIDGPGWEVRTPRRGDRVVPLGGIGHRPLRRLLMEARVPRGERGRYPVVARGETILWVPGICRSADQLPRPGTPAVRLDVIRDAEQ